MKQLWVLALLLGLVAARPWGLINHHLGLEPAPSENLIPLESDSLMAQPMIIQLPPAAVDTLSLRVAQRDSLKRVLELELKAKEKSIAGLQKKLRKKQQDLVSLEEIHAMTEIQKKSGGDP
ncbi:hypothetical protein ACS5NO_12855 [Larkinella sp. GY13]|jgi:hypothetical protein|uniref:hypothetical protein n=1 Tax=Larkinella sp. GY13 TaxID=3453720 RepID=UPI003EE904DD